VLVDAGYSGDYVGQCLAKADLLMSVMICLPIAARMTRQSGLLYWP
jgi:hypothetical protein